MKEGRKPECPEKILTTSFSKARKFMPRPHFSIGGRLGKQTCDVKIMFVCYGVADLVFHEYKPWDDPFNKTANLVGVSHVSTTRWRHRQIDSCCCLSRLYASVFQGPVCSENVTCCHTEIKVADQTFYITQSQYADIRPVNPRADPITPGTWQGRHCSANLKVTGMNRQAKIPVIQAGIEPRIFGFRGGRLNH